MSRPTGLISGLVVLMLLGVLGVTLFTSMGNGTTATAPDTTVTPFAESHVTETTSTIAANTPTPPNTDNDSDGTHAPAAQTNQPDTITPCTFDAQTDPALPSAPAIDTYTFAEPEVLLQGSLFDLHTWLPDNQRLFLTQWSEGGKNAAFTTFDIQTGATETYAERSGRRVEPVWIESEQAVVFPEFVSDDQLVLYVSRGNDQAPKELAHNLQTPFISVDRTNQRITFLSQDTPGNVVSMALAPDLQLSARTETAIAGLVAPTRIQLDPWYSVHAIWHPDGQRVVFYDNTGAYLSDTSTNTQCALDLGGDNTGTRWPLYMEWSPNGRFLAARTTIGGSKGNLPFVDVTVLDMVTGDRQHFDVDVQYVEEFRWMTNGEHILALGKYYQDSTVVNPYLFLIDVARSQSQRMLPDYTFGAGFFESGTGSLIVSPENDQIAVRCPLPQEDRVCLIKVGSQQ